MSLGDDLDRGELTKSALEEMEKKVLDEFPKYMSLDLASIIASFFRLSYVPRILLHELNRMSALSTMNKYSCLVVLESFVQARYDESNELYDKLFAQLQKTSSNLNAKLSGRALSILSAYLDIFKSDRERVESIVPVVDFYLNRFNDAAKVPSM